MRSEIDALVSRVDRYKETGLSLVKRLREASYATILDVGCGSNMYKPFLPQVIGIDVVPP